MTTPHTLPENGNVHVWCFEGTGLSSDLAQSLSETLSSDERLAIARFRDARLREYRTAGRAMLRQVLSSYLRVPMATVVLGVGRHGKPLVVTPQAHCLQFNVSHSDAITLIAVANGQEVGIDVERVRGDLPIDTIAPASFSSAEWNTFRQAPEAEHVATFFPCWTRKEAVLKAEGVGLNRALNSVEVGIGTLGEITRTDALAVLSLDVAPGCAAAVAVEGKEIAATTYVWDPAEALTCFVNLPGL